MMWRIALAVLITALSGNSLAARACKPPEDFRAFLSHFEADPAFQEVRIASPVRVLGPVADAAVAESERAEKLSVRSFLATYGGFPSPKARAARGLETDIVATDTATVSVRVFIPNSSAYNRSYRFTRVRGCWSLESLAASRADAAR